MRRYWWPIIAVACVLMLIVVGVIFIPRLFETGTKDDGQVEMIPAHWWKADLSEQQMETIAGLWGSDTPVADLLQKTWPDVFLQMPLEALGAYERQKVHWPTAHFEDWNGEMIAGVAGVYHDEGTTVYYYYLGRQEYELMTMRVSPERGFTEDRMYRVSLYTDIREGAYP